MSQQIQISGGAKVRALEGVITGTSGVLSSVPLGGANGVATLDSGGKVPVSQLPSSVVTYLGTWNAATNTPTLVNGTGDAGDMYICNVQGTVNFGAGPVTFAVGDWVLYGSGTWQKSSGQNGTVTSVAASITGNAVGLTGSPITTAGTLAFAFAGTNLQYVNGAGNLTTFPTLITSIGLSMPSAFSVANSPLTANGTIAVTGAGTTAQYIRGDGSLATFPTIATEAQRLITEVYNETGATLTKGTVVYINGGHGNLPTITKAIATGDATSAQTYGIVQTDITNMNNGYVVVIGSLTDLDTQAYANGTQLYLSSTTAGAWTSTKQYAPAHLVYVGIVTRSHPTQGVVEVRIQNGFEMDELHNVSAQSPLNNQGLFYNTSTSLWENKSIATALGYTPANDALVVHNTGNETIGGTKTFSDATKNNGGIFLQNASSNSLAGYMNIGGLTNGVKFTSGGGISNTFTLPSATGYTFTFPNATGTIALTSDIPSITGLVPYTGATGDVNLGLYSLTSNSIKVIGDNSTYGGTLSIKQSNVTNLIGVGYTELFGKTNRLGISFGAGSIAYLSNSTLTTDRTYTFPDASGTIALVGGSGVGTVTSVAALTIGTTGTDLSSSVANSTTTPVITLNVPTASATNRGALSSADWTTFNNKQSALTNPVTGTGTTNYLPKFTGTSTIGNSIVQDSGSAITITGSNYLFNLSGGGSSRIAASINNTSGNLEWGLEGSAGNQLFTGMAAYQAGIGTSNNTSLNFATNTVVRMQLNSSGNLGLGVTPSAWGSGAKAIEIAGGSMFSFDSASLFISQNAYFDTSWKYKSNGFASYYYMVSGGHQWLTAPSGTAGATFTFTQAMTLTAAGRLLINKTNEETYQLDVNGTGRFSGITTFGSTGGSGLRVYGGSGTNQWDVYLNSTNLRFSDNTGTGSIVFDRPLSGTTASFSGNLTTLGSVGVGGTNTDSLLTVNGTAGTCHERFREGSTTVGLIGGANGIITGQNGKLAVRAESGLVLSGQGNSADMLLTGGNVLIGITSDNGRRLRVSTSSADYAAQISQLGSSGGSHGLTIDCNTSTSTNIGLEIYSSSASVYKTRLYTDGSAIFSSSVTAANGYFGPTSNQVRLTSQGTFQSTTLDAYIINADGTGAYGSGDLLIQPRCYSGGGANKIVFATSNNTNTPVERFTIASTGAATFSSSVTATNYFASSTESFRTYNDNGYISFFNSANTTRQGYIQVQSTAMTLAAEGGGAFMAFTTAGSERMRITSGGNVLIGTTDDGGRLVSYSTNAATQFKAAGTAPAITFSNTVLSPTIGGVLGVCTAASQFFTGTASSDMVLANQFSAGALIFGTSNVERVRITLAGNLLMGKTVTGAVLNNGFEYHGPDNYLSICNSTSSNYSLYVANTGTSGTRNMVAFYGTSSLVGSITYNGTTTLFNSTSDYRLKEDLKDFNALNVISKLKTYDFKWKNTDVRDYGMMAHELQEVLPNYVSGEKDALDVKGNIKTQQVDYSKIVPILVKSIQELKLEIETLKNK